MFVSNKSKVSSSRWGDKISGAFQSNCPLVKSKWIELIEIDSMSIDFTCAFPTANSSLRSFLYKQVAAVTEQGNTCSLTTCKVNVSNIGSQRTTWQK